MNYFLIRQSCPGCKSIEHKTIYSCKFIESPIKEYLESFYKAQGGVEFEYLNEAEFVLDECNNCGLIYQREIPNNFLRDKLYKEWIDPKKIFKIEVEESTLDYYVEYAQEIMILIVYFKTLPSKLKFFDFGMGWCNWARMAKAFGCNSYGIELSEEKVDYAKSYGINVITWNNIPDYRFDFINIEYILEHISEPQETLCYFKNSLKPKGLIKINVPDGSDIKRRMRILDWSAPKGSKNSLNAVSPLEHINCFDWESLIKMADIAGFKQAKIPLGIQYMYRTNWKPLKPILKNILKPLYQNMLKKGTYLFFCHK